jgi:[acyl-carrier-protein] S-malonyltransferase
VVPANHNSPGQLVISGHVSAVKRAVEAARSHGAKLARELPVSGAFHSPLMKPAAESLAAALKAAPLKTPRITVISNVTAKPHSDAETMRTLLADQLLSPVRWTESIMELARTKDARWFEVGSGNVLAGLLKRIVPGASAVTVASAADLDKLT